MDLTSKVLFSAFALGVVLLFAIGTTSSSRETPEAKVANLERVCREEYASRGERAVFDCIVNIAGRWGRAQAVQKADSVYDRTVRGW